MSAVFYRIDDRLVHGQIMTAWAKVLRIGRIIVVDSATAKNSFLAQVMQMSVPNEYTLHVCESGEGAELIRALAPDEHALVLAKTPAVMKELFLAGVEMKELNVGGMGARGGRKIVARGVLVDEAELQTLKELVGAGVRVYCQSVPDVKPVEITADAKI